MLTKIGKKQVPTFNSFFIWKWIPHFSYFLSELEIYISFNIDNNSSIIYYHFQILQSIFFSSFTIKQQDSDQ